MANGEDVKTGMTVGVGAVVCILALYRDVSLLLGKEDQ
jgi:hypothetical protein